jgi:hypothetical protein
MTEPKPLTIMNRAVQTGLMGTLRTRAMGVVDRMVHGHASYADPGEFLYGGE